MTTCPKCGYVRKSTDQAPDYECPACGVVYAKVLSRLAAAASPAAPAKPAAAQPEAEKAEEPKPTAALAPPPEPGHALGSVLRLGAIALVLGLMAYGLMRPKPAEAPAAVPETAEGAVPPDTVPVPAVVGPETELGQGLGAFTGVEMSCPGRLVVDSGSAYSVKASGDVSTLQLQTMGGTLAISCSGRAPPTLHLVMPTLNALYLHTRTEAVLNEVSSDSLEIRNEAGGRISGSGRVTTLRVRTGAGMVDLGKLAADEAEVSVARNAAVTVNAVHRLKGAVFGGMLVDRGDDAEDMDLQANGGSIAASGHVRTLTLTASAGRVNLDTLVASTATVSVSGSANAVVHVEGSLEANSSGSSTVRAFGSAGELKAQVENGRGDFQQLTVDDAVVSIRGGGTILTAVTHSLEATVDGAGQVLYRGNPAIVTPRIHGSGQVRPLP